MVNVEFRKSPDMLHWNYQARFLGEDEFGTWLGVPEGSELRKGLEVARTITGSFVQNIALGRWWTMVRNTGHRASHYVDIIVPAVWERPDHVTMIDLDLDVVRLNDGNVILEDEDEFLDHQVRLNYPDFWIDKARTTAAAVLMDVEQGIEPFGEVADAWLHLLGQSS